MTDQNIDEIAATLRQQLDDAEQHCQELLGFMSGFGPSMDLPMSPARTLVAVQRDRRLLDLLLAEEHTPVRIGPDDFSCETQYDPPRRCDCGRDVRVVAYLELLTEPYATEAS